MTIQENELTFQSKISGSTTPNPNIAKLNGVEFTQLQYDQIYASELRVNTVDVLEFEFPVPNEYQLGLQEVDIYYKSKMDSGENELRASDKGIYNNDTTTYKQKMLAIYTVDIENNIIKFRIDSTGDYGIYEVKCNVIWDDQGMNRYTGNYSYADSGNDITVPIVNKKMEDIFTELESKPSNSISYVSFVQVPTEGNIP